MRLALMTAAVAALMACEAGPGDSGPERRDAAGEVLGGEVTDDMLPLDTVRSTSPAEPRRAASGTGDTATPAGSEPTPPPLDQAEMSGGPVPDTNALEDRAPPTTPTPE